ncbi:hypothetical protein BU15DRAFT_60188 [Melanogaster broomeanus]|nr:hypothetical protein BU15DRAFT_60188 [Melanogaster broomeanus]
MLVRKTTEERITITRSSRQPDATTTSPGSMSFPSPTSKLSTSPAKPSSRPAARPPPPAIHLSSYVPPVPHPSAILPPSRHATVQGYWVVTVSQEVSIFYSWSDVAERTDFISGNRQHKVSSFEDALAVYRRKYNEGSVRAVPTPGGPFLAPIWASSSCYSPDPFISYTQ